LKEIHAEDFPETSEEYRKFVQGLYETEGNEEKLFQTRNVLFRDEKWNEKSYFEEPVFEGF